MDDVSKELLKGVHVLEISNGPSGGYAGRMFAESGAAVTKVTGRSPLSPFLDAEKKILHTDDEKETIAHLLKQKWDIVIWDNYCETLDKLLTNYFSKKPLLSVGVRIDLPADNHNEEYALQSQGGWTALTGDPNRSPLAVGGNPASYLVGAHAATAGMLAYVERDWTSQGRLVQIQSLTIVASALEGAISNYHSTGYLRGRVGNRHNKLSPMAILPSQDGWVFVGAPIDEMWEMLERWADLPHRKEWLNAQGRSNDCLSIETELANWTKTMSSNDLFLTGQAFRMPFAKVQSPQDLLSCPQLSARRSVIRTDSNQVKLSLPWKVSLNDNLQHGKRRMKSWKGLRVLDLTCMWSGPYCTRLFADLNAEVIKVEAPHRTDGIRSDDGSSPFFKELNRNKLGIQLDLRLKADRQKFLKLVEVSDVLVENFSPRVMSNFNLEPEELWKHKSDLVIVSLSAFGQTGPYRDFVGYGPTLESMSGLAAATHYGDGHPWLPGFSISDIGAGIHGAFALSLALHLRNQSGAGVRVDQSQYETACQFVGEQVTEGVDSIKQGEAMTANELSDLVQDERISKLALQDGEIVLGTPWESEGWKSPNRMPPTPGQHTEEIFRMLINASHDSERILC